MSPTTEIDRQVLIIWSDHMKQTKVGAAPFRIEQSSWNQINHFSEREAKTLAAPKVYLPK